MPIFPFFFRQNQISSVLSESIKCSLPPGESLFVVRRVNIVLNYIYKVEVAQRYILPKVCIFVSMNSYQHFFIYS